MTALAEAIPRPRTRNANLAVDVALVVGGSLFIALMAQVTVHLRFVPITGQTLAVVLVGAAMGWKKAGLAVALYLAEGAAGLPFFASGRAGIDFLILRDPLHVTGGYLWGFLPAAMLVGFLAERGWDRRFVGGLGAMLLGNLVIFSFGLPWLAAALGIPVLDAAATPCNLATAVGCDALELGLYPFVIGDVLKLLLAAGLLPAAWRLVGADRR